MRGQCSRRHGGAHDAHSSGARHPHHEQTKNKACADLNSMKVEELVRPPLRQEAYSIVTHGSGSQLLLSEEWEHSE